MNPYYKRDGIAIFHGDCREVLPELPPASVDAVIADPPYGDTSLDWDSVVDGWLVSVRRAMTPVGSLWCWGSLRFFIDHGAAFAAAGWRLAQDVVWEKHNGSNFHADRFKRVHENAVQFYRADQPWASIYREVQTTPDAVPRAVRRKKRPTHTGNVGEAFYVSVDGGPRLMRSVFHERSCHGYAVHPTQKPERVIAPLVSYSCPRGGGSLGSLHG